MVLRCFLMCLMLAGINAVILPPDISDFEMEFIDNLSDKFMNAKPEIDLSKIAKESSKCYKDSIKYLNALKKFEFWALKMHDASARMPTGMLYGNVHSFGNFDECLEVVEPNNEFQGQYCLATMQVTVAKDAAYLNFLRNQALSYELFTSKINDTNHMGPSFSKIQWAFCLPSSCSPQQLESLLQSQLNNFTSGTVLNIEAYVEPKLCQVKESLISKIDGSTIMTIFFFGIIFLISFLSTIFESNSWLKAFSVSENLRMLFTTHQHPSDITVIHGIRCICVLLVFFDHKIMMLPFRPSMYRTKIVESSLSNPVGLILRGGYVITDVFLMLSGFVASYIVKEQSERMKKVPILGAYILRYMRMIPSLMVVTLIATFILPLLGDGPLFPFLIKHASQMCKTNGWMNMLMLQNFYIPFNDMCLIFSYHVSIDFQLFLLVPFMVIVLLKWPEKGAYGFIILSIIISVVNFINFRSSGYSKFAVIGFSYQDGNDMMDKNLSLTPYRFPVFTIGVLLGFYIKECKMFELTKVQRLAGWALAAGGLLGIYYNMFLMSALDYEKNTTISAVFASFAPVVLCLSVGWTIFVSQLGDSNGFIKFLQWKGFIITTNLSYSIFLVQFLIIFFSAGTTRAVSSFGVYSWLVANFEETLLIVVAAISLTLFIEMPVKNICNLILKSKKQKGKEN